MEVEEEDIEDLQTEIEDAERFALANQKILLYCETRAEWIAWERGVWVPVGESGALRCAVTYAKGLIEKAKGIENQYEREQALKHAKKVSTSRYLTAILRLSPSVPGMSVGEEIFDVDPWRLNCRNGVLDLQKRTLVAHEAAQRHFKMAQVEYDETATCPKWDAFLGQIFGGNQDLVDYIHRILGYSLTGLVEHQAWFFFYGSGANGKSTLLQVIQAMMGNYCMSAQPTTFLRQNADTVRTDIARLRGARMIVIAETDASHKMDLSLLKQFSAGDHLTARHLYGREFSYSPVGKLFFHGNNKPALSASDDGTWRRPRLIPFTVQIAAQDQIKNFHHLLLEEAPGILNKLLRGLQQVLESASLNDPESVKLATSLYRSDFDLVASWIEDRCTKGQYEAFQPLLYADFLEYVRCEGYPDNLHPKTFAKLLDQKGIAKIRRTPDGWTRGGIILKYSTSNPLGQIGFFEVES